MIGMISDIKRFAVHDGPGIRTTLFLKGCPLRCLWCHNPENLRMKPDLFYTHRLCVGCRDCETACPHGCHVFTSAGITAARITDARNDTERTPVSSQWAESAGIGRHTIDRTACTGCGACADACLPGALRIYGKPMDAARAAELLLEDADFFRQSGGGVTFSGGEPLLQPEFCAAVMRQLKNRTVAGGHGQPDGGGRNINGVHIAVDTCCDVPWGAFETVLPHTDLFLCDLKHTDPHIYRKWTGGAAQRVLDNLKTLDSCGVPIELRVTIVPGFNDDDRALLDIGGFAASMNNITRVRLLAYHNMSGAKYAAIGLADIMPETAPPSAQKMDAAKSLLSGVCPNVCLSGDE